MPFNRFLGAAGLMLISSAVLAAPVSVTTVLAPQEQMRFEMGDGTPHFVLAVRREGVSEGEGALAGARVTEFGWHDIQPPMGGDPRGYLRFEAGNGDVAIMKFTVRAVFMKGRTSPNSTMTGSGNWSAAGQFAYTRGVGALRIEQAGDPKRLFTMTGEIGDKP